MSTIEYKNHVIGYEVDGLPVINPNLGGRKTMEEMDREANSLTKRLEARLAIERNQHAADGLGYLALSSELKEFDKLSDPDN